MSRNRLRSEQLTPEQRVVLEASGDLLVVGRPGTGKTSIALLKAVRHVTESKNEDAQVLFLSFSRAAVQRIEAAARIYVPRTQAKRIVITTFHGFCFDVLSSHARLLGMPRLAGVVLPHEERVIISEAARAAQDTLQTPQGGEARDDIDMVVGHAIGVLAGHHAIDECTDRLRTLLDSVLAQTLIERLRLERSEGRVPFDRLLDLVLELFKRHEDLANAYARAFSLLVVDEYQDTNDKQDELVDVLAAHGQTIYLGDPEQRIYDWIKDVRADRFERLVARRHPARVSLPVTCHRSGASDLVVYGHAVRQGASLTFKPADVTPLGYGVGKLYDKLRIAVGIAKKAAKKRLGESARPELAVMGYTNRLVGQMSAELRTATEKFGPFHHRLHIGLEEVAPAWTLVLSLLALPPTGNNTKGFADALHQFARYELSRKGVGRAKRGDALASAAHAVRSGVKVGARALRDLRERITQASASFTGDVRQDVRKLVDVLRATTGEYFDEVADVLELRSPADGCDLLVEQLVAAYATHGYYRDASTLGNAFLVREHLVRSEPGGGGLVLMTLHKCKGKEFDAVVIVDGASDTDSLIVRGDDAQLSRSRRLLATAIARARYHVVIVKPGYREARLLPRIPKSAARVRKGDRVAKARGTSSSQPG